MSSRKCSKSGKVGGTFENLNAKGEWRCHTCWVHKGVAYDDVEQEETKEEGEQEETKEEGEQEETKKKKKKKNKKKKKKKTTYGQRN